MFFDRNGSHAHSSSRKRCSIEFFRIDTNPFTGLSQMTWNWPIFSGNSYPSITYHLCAVPNRCSIEVTASVSSERHDAWPIVHRPLPPDKQLRMLLKYTQQD